MTIKIGIYDFFSYTIPGLLYLFGIGYALSIFGLITIDIFTVNVSLIQSIVIVILAYITGFILEPLANLWNSFFKSRDFPSKTFEKYKKLHPHLNPSFHGEDWAILLARIRLEKPEVAGEIEKNNAINIMLRNISFSLLILAIIEIIRCVQFFSSFHIALSAVSIVASVIAGKRGVSFSSWFYLMIFETSTVIEEDRKSALPKNKSQEKVSRKL